ncbi:MAG TPA: aldo/keto reductase [Acidobacteriaceae bacterium]|jgi:aryl-alcohol dehydrogenase-like predicted oxidoreductase|nr:aldo/keto reductase [Acidobacteriaceae bacterium]
MSPFSRREFLRTGAAAGALAGLGTLPLAAEKQTATDWVTLGRSDLKVTRLAFGTGTYSGALQRNLGQEGFNRLVRHAYDSGIRFFETSDSYDGMHSMLGIALRGLPRDSYRIMTKVTTEDAMDPQQKIDDLRRQVNSDYFDILLLHWQHTGSWVNDTRHWQDAVVVAQKRGAVRVRGASVHGLPALRQVPSFDWLQVAMIRVNHKGSRMDTEVADGPGLGNVSEVVSHIHQARAAGMGVISMKLTGEGTFSREDRQKAMQFAFRNAGVDSVTVGYKNNAEVDEAIENINIALA